MWNKLKDIGVSETTLSLQQKEALNEQGYLVLPDVVESGWLAELREEFERAAREEKMAGGKEGGTRHIAKLEFRGEPFWRIMRHPLLLAAAWETLQRPFRSDGVDGRDPRAGHGLQGIHQDAPPRAPSAPFTLLNSLWLLDDFTPENGATRVVAGSHRLAGKPLKIASEPTKSYPGEVVVTAKAGSVLIFNGHLLHGGTQNRSGCSRRVLRSGAVPRDQIRNWGYEPPTIEKPLPPAVQFLLEL